MNIVKAIGTIAFDPVDMTKKHGLQASWKRVAMVMLKGDIAEYYAWFIRRRYSIILNTPLRDSHVTFINDREGDTNGFWSETKDRWDGMEIELSLNTDVRTNAEFWWLRVEPHETLNRIRAELSLGDPFFSYHMTIGYPVNRKWDSGIEGNAMKATEMHIEQSRYIHGLLSRGMIQ